MKFLKIWQGLFLAIILSSNLSANKSANLTFDGLYASFGALGLELSDQVKNNENKIVTISGFMAPPLKANANFFVLTKYPMAFCPFCSSDADWPPDILVVYLKKTQSFVSFNTPIEVKGRLEIGSKTDENTGFVSLMRIMDAEFKEK